MGSKDDDEFGFRARQSNNGIKILDLKDMHKESKIMLQEHINSSNYIKSFIKSH